MECKIDDIGNWSSIIGLVITLFTLGYAYFIEKKISSLESKVLFNTRMMALVDDLKVVNREVFQFLDDFDNCKPQIKVSLNKTRIILQSIKKKSSSNERTEIKSGIKNHKKALKKVFSLPKTDQQLTFWQTEITENEVWDLYSNVSAIITHIENNVLDKRITG